MGQAGYPIPETLRQTDDLIRRVTRFANPSKVVRAFLENVGEVRQWHTEAQVLYEFIRDKRLPAFQRARLLLNEIDRAQGVRGSEPLTEENSLSWRERLQELVESGSAAHEWDEFTSALTPLQERFKSAYTSLHKKRDRAVGEARQKLEAVSAPVQPLFTYECQGLKWVEDELKCAQCSAPLKELYLQTVALPNLVRELRDAYESTIRYGEEAPSIRRVRVAEVVPKRQIMDEADLTAALDAVREEVTKALAVVEVVELE